MRYLVTGASGFLGAWTVRALQAAGCDVVGVTRDPSPWRLAGADGVRVVAAPPANWPDVVAAEAPDVLIALDWSGVAGPARDGPEQDDNVDRLDAVLEAALGAGVRRFVGCGSQAEYGWRDGPIDEDAQTRPVTAYGRAKVAALERVRERCDDRIEWIWARIFSVFGPLDNEGNVLASVARALRSGQTLDVSRGGQPWSFLYASDCARALASLALPGTPDGIVNVAHPDASTLQSSLTTFAGAVTPSLGSLRFGPEDGPGLQADVTRLLATGWRPEVPVATGLESAARWYSGIALADDLLGGELPARPSDV
ncbi:MAG: NAD(P)-dependent oxidoreductase [Pseudolysinimonas sp.]